jgi:ABC-type branched-subunit amino acid transport system ATPase component
MEEVNAKTWSILDAVGLADVAAEPCINLPHGAKRLLEIGITLAIDSKLLLLDEPLAGLDPGAAAAVAPLRAGGTRVLISHDVEHGLDEADLVLGLRGGRPVLLGDAVSAAEIRGLYG